MSRKFTLEELKDFNGEKRKEIFISVQGKIYDVTDAKDFYGPGSGYHVFAGKECSRALATMSLKAEDCTGNLEGLEEKQLKVLDDWQRKFDEKYPFVGRLDD